MQLTLFRITTPRTNDVEVLPDGQTIITVESTTYEALTPPVVCKEPFSNLLVQIVMAGNPVSADRRWGYSDLVVFTRWLDKDRMEWVYEDGLEFRSRLQAAKSELHRRVYTV